MSDPMTNAEVEDVLSSIRRLVADEKPADASPAPAAAPDRLVLTPSLRVTDAEEAPDAEDAPERATYDAEADHETGAAPEHVDAWSDAEDADAAEMVAEETPDATIETLVEDDDDGEEEVFYRAPSVDLDAPEVQPAEEAAADDAFDVDAQDVAPEADRTLSDKIAALETLVADRADEWEPDDTGSDAYAGTQAPTLEWEDADSDEETVTFSHFGAAAAASVIDAEEEHDDDDDAQVFSSDEDVLDEDALRDLVADIVREELQGALGERITRNVRKLVRREIHRALAAQDLE